MMISIKPVNMQSNSKAIEQNHGHLYKRGYELNENLEMYLKIIYRQVKKHKVARVKNIASELGVNNSSVTKTLKLLAEKNYILYNPYNYISLTEEGEQLAEKINSKYELITHFFTQFLKIPLSVAEENACRVEHVIDDEVCNKLEIYMEENFNNIPCPLNRLTQS